RASPGLFAMLGIQPALGRELRWDADEIVISDEYWRREFHSDPHVVGRGVLYGDRRYSVAGVLGPERGYPTSADLWILASPTPRSSGYILARLPNGIPAAAALKRAQAAVAVIASRPGLLRAPPHMIWRLSVGALGQVLAPPASRRALLVLLVAVGCVLLIACANTAALLLARGAGRQREFAVRRALGASRGRLVRQLLAEAVCLSAGGGALGWLLAEAAMHMARLGPDTIPRLRTAHLDPRVLGFGLAAALLSGLVCGAAPAFRFSRPDLQRGFQGGAPATRRSSRSSLLLTVEIALSLVLLVGAGLLLRSLDHMLDVSTGFNPHSLLKFDVITPESFGRAATVQRSLLHQRTLERIRALPGVVSASDGGNSFDGYDDLAGEPYSRQDKVGGTVHAATHVVGQGYFQTLGADLLRGRDFGPADMMPPPQAVFDATPAKPVAAAPVPVLVNQALAQALWSGSDPVGQILIFEPSEQELVVGVVANLRDSSLAEGVRPEVYQPMMGNYFDATFLVRSSLPPAALTQALRRTLRATDASIQMG